MEDEYFKQALSILKAQASVRVMTEEEMIAFVQNLTQAFSKLALDPEAATPVTEPAADARKSIREKSITCLECDKVFKVLTQRHLASHGLTPDDYREKWGLKEHTPLVCKALQRERRKKMKEMRLWEKRRKPGEAD